jgi:AbrB family looped-hinge helix DNA binding protein
VNAKKPIAVKVDAKGKITLPKSISDKIHVQTGEIVYIVEDGKGGLRIFKEKKPTPAQIEAMRILGKKAEEDYKVGKTISHEEMKRILNLE